MPHPYVDIRCLSCENIFTICSSCYRGQRYCSTACRSKNYTKLAKMRAHRYRKTIKGMLNGRRRQNTYRSAQADVQRSTKKNVTHATSISPIKPTDSSNGSTNRKCIICGKPVSINMQGSSHPATEFRRMRDYPATKGRNKKALLYRKVEKGHHCQSTRSAPSNRGQSP